MKNNERTILISARIVALVAVGFFAGATFFGWRSHDALGVVAKEYRELVAQEEHIIALRALARASEEDWQALGAYIVRRSDIVAYLENIERIARNAGLASKVQTVESAKDTSLSLRLEVRGTFAGVMLMLYRLETLPYVAFVNVVNLEYVDDGVWAAYIELIAPAYVNDQP